MCSIEGANREPAESRQRCAGRVRWQHRNRPARRKEVFHIHDAQRRCENGRSGTVSIPKRDSILLILRSCGAGTLPERALATRTRMPSDVRSSKQPNFV